MMRSLKRSPPILRSEIKAILKRRRYGENAWLPGEQVHAINAPFRGALRRQLALIATQKERRPRGPVGGLHFDEALMAVWIKRVDVVTGPVSVFFRYPSDLSSQVVTISLSELFSFNLDNKGLAGLS